MLIHWHPESKLIIRDDAGEILFMGSLVAAEAVLGESLAPLPEGVRERQYFVGQYIADFARQGQVDGPASWPQGDAIVARLADFQAAEAARLAELEAKANGTWIE